MNIKLTLLLLCFPLLIVAQKKRKKGFKQGSEFKVKAKKNNLKEAQKFFYSKNYKSALSRIRLVEKELSKLRGEERVNLYYLKGMSTLGQSSTNLKGLKNSLTILKKSQKIQDSIKSYKYSKDLKIGIKKANNAIENLAYSQIKNGQLTEAATIFDLLYKQNTKDTVYLYNAAINLNNANAYDKALTKYKKLSNLGYTGIKNQYTAKNVSTGEIEAIPSKVDLDGLLKSGTHTDGKLQKLPSKAGEIAKTIALIYIEKGEDEKALAAFNKAKKINPNDKTINKTQATLYFNKGVSFAKANENEKAIDAYKKSLKALPNYASANLNVAAILLGKDSGYVTKINSINSRKEPAAYKQAVEERAANYRELLPYLEKYYELKPDDSNVGKTLLSIYQTLKSPKANSLKAKLGGL